MAKKYRWCRLLKSLSLLLLLLKVEMLDYFVLLVKKKISFLCFNKVDKKNESKFFYFHHDFELMAIFRQHEKKLQL